MPNRFAQGRKAFGYCARCGQRADLSKLKYQIIKQKITNLRVCAECLDEDQPQLMLGTFPIDDPQALRDPRPDPALAQSRAIPDNGLNITNLFVPPNPVVTFDYLVTEEGDFLLTESGDLLLSAETISY